jgi:hypothetical protein
VPSMPTWAQRVLIAVLTIAIAIAGTLFVKYMDSIDKLISNIQSSTGEIEQSVKSHGEAIATLGVQIKSLSDNYTSDTNQGKFLTDVSISLARLDEKVKSLEREVYKFKAEAVGIKNPQIVSTSLNRNQEFESKTSTSNGEVLITYKVVDYDPSKKTLRLKLQARLPRGRRIKDTVITIRDVRSGSTANIMLVADAEMPKLFLHFLELPSPNQAILAIGERTASSPKSS